MGWTDLSGVFTFGSQLTSTQQQNLRDNAVYNKGLNNSNSALQYTEVNTYSLPSYVTKARACIYIGEDQETLNLIANIFAFNGTPGIRVTLTDSAGNSISDTATTASTTPYVSLPMSLDVTSIDQGEWALAEIKLYGNVGFGGITGYWDLYRY